jgi:hypothetical protein
MERNFPPRVSCFVPDHHEFSMGANARPFKTNVWMSAITKSYWRHFGSSLMQRRSFGISVIQSIEQ